MIGLQEGSSLINTRVVVEKKILVDFGMFFASFIRVFSEKSLYQASAHRQEDNAYLALQVVRY